MSDSGKDTLDRLIERLAPTKFGKWLGGPAAVGDYMLLAAAIWMVAHRLNTRVGGSLVIFVAIILALPLQRLRRQMQSVRGR